MHLKVGTNEICHLGNTTSFNIDTNKQMQSVGKQMQYYRQMKNIRAKDMAMDLNIGYNTIWRLEHKTDEQYNLNHLSVQIINKIIDYLDIRNKLDYTHNEYMDFIINNQSKTIRQLLINYKTYELADILNVNRNTITHWLNNEVVISKENYFKIKKMLEIK